MSYGGSVNVDGDYQAGGNDNQAKESKKEYNILRYPRNRKGREIKGKKDGRRDSNSSYETPLKIPGLKFKNTLDSSTSADDSPEQKYSEMVQKIIQSSTSTDESAESKFAIHSETIPKAPDGDPNLDLKPSQTSISSTEDNISQKIQTTNDNIQSAQSNEDILEERDGITESQDDDARQVSEEKERVILWKQSMRDGGLWDKLASEDDRDILTDHDDQRIEESSAKKTGEQSSFGEYSDSRSSRPKITTSTLFDNPWKKINVMRHRYQRDASREMKIRERLQELEEKKTAKPKMKSVDEDKSECSCKLGKPQNMYAEGHEVSCKVWYPTADPCVLTECPEFRGRMLFNQPGGKSEPTTKKKPLYKPPYEFKKKPHYRQTLLMEELRRIELERRRARLMTPGQRMQHSNRLRQAMPVLSYEEIRQFRRPFHEWIVLELRETDYPESADFIQKLLKISQKLQDEATSVKFKWKNLRLEDYPPVAKMLVKSLIDSENCLKTMPPNLEGCIDQLLEVALQLMEVAEGFYWVVEQILLWTLSISTRCKRDSSHREALVRYVYGYLLAEKLDQHAIAIEQLTQARSMSLSKKWEIEYPTLEPRHKNLNLQCTYYLCRVMIHLAKEVRTIDTLSSVKLLSKALRLLGDPILIETQASVLLELGISYEMLGEFRMAHVVMQRYLAIPNRSLEPPGKCSAYLEMAFCHRLLGENVVAEAYLRETIRTAKEAQSRELNAVAHKYVGIGYMAMGYNKKASVYFERSFKLFKELELSSDLDYVRVVAAISKGTEILPHMAELINETVDDPDEEAKMKLLEWMNYHLPFWDETSKDAPQVFGLDLFNVIRPLAPGQVEEKEKPPEKPQDEGTEKVLAGLEKDTFKLIDIIQSHKRPQEVSNIFGHIRKPRESLTKKAGGEKWLPTKEKGEPDKKRK